MHETFRRIAQETSRAVGAPKAFITACVVVVVWAIVGPFFNFSDTWQLAINTGTTILTFLMVFLIQNTQNRDAHAIHLKLDELIKSQKRARNEFIDVEDMADEQLDQLQSEFQKIRNDGDSVR
jgi:low affinity Fe/Cu permease